MPKSSWLNEKMIKNAHGMQKKGEIKSQRPIAKD